MDLVSSWPFWPIVDGVPVQFPALTRDARCDVVVIGAGITGALVAWHLAEAGIDTIVVDRRTAAHGSTAASTSLLQYELDEPLSHLTRNFGRSFAERCYHRCREAIGAIERLVHEVKVPCGFSRRSSLLLAANKSHVARLRREFAAREAAGFAVEWWSRRRVADESTLPHPAAILSRDGAEVDAYRLAFGLLAAARVRGVRVFDHTEVVRRRVDRRGVELVTANGFRIRAREVVIAAGYEADRQLPQATTALHSTFALVSEPVGAFAGWPANRCIIWETRRPYLYLRTTPDNRVMIGGYDENFPDPVARDEMLPRKTAVLLRRFRQFFPRIPIEVATSWAGTFATTAHGLPFIGLHPKHPHTRFALGYGGNGVTFGIIAAEIIRAALTGDVDRDAALFGFDRRTLCR
jgi:glycine/D-amino acid oxidase-like deaminating enzyme